MPSSSTSSSSQLANSAHLRLPPAARPRTVLVAALLVLALLAGWELLLAATGVAADPTHGSPDRIAGKLRAAAKSEAPRVLALGSSRTFVGVNTTDVAAHAGVPADMLTLAGSSAMGLLRPLADTGAPPGIVLVEVLPAPFYSDSVGPLALQVSTSLNQAGLYADAGLALDDAFCRLRLVGASGSPSEWLRAELRRRMYPETDAEPAATSYVIHEDGWHELSPNAAFLVWARQEMNHMAEMVRRGNRPGNAERWDALLAELTRLDAQLASRGAIVIFVRFPSSGALYEAEQEVYPDERYWNRLVAAFPGRAWHFRDNPEFHNLDLPDGSHLVGTDARRFSRWLGQRVAPLVASLPKQPSD